MSTAEPDSDRLTGDLPPDPLLQSGCFIEPTTTSNGETLLTGTEEPNSNGVEAAAPTSAPQSDQGVGTPLPAAAQKPSSTGEETASSAPDGADAVEDSKPRRRKRLSLGERRVATGEAPDWLPPGWIVEDRVRASGATAGSVDKYYCDPVSGHVFRSKKEVLYYLENGTKRKKHVDNVEVDGAGTPGESSAGSHKKKASSGTTPLNFDFMNPPEKVTWVLSDFAEGSWTPYIDDKKVAESVSREWAAAFTFLTVRKR